MYRKNFLSCRKFKRALLVAVLTLVVPYVGGYCCFRQTCCAYDLNLLSRSDVKVYDVWSFGRLYNYHHDRRLRLEKIMYGLFYPLVRSEEFLGRRHLFDCDSVADYGIIFSG